MYQTLNTKWREVLATNNLFSLKSLLKILTFYVLLTLTYLVLILFNNTSSNSSSVEYAWYNTMLVTFLFYFSPMVLLFPILYVSYMLGKESKLRLPMKIINNSFRLIFLYCLAFLFYLPGLFILSQIDSSADIIYASGGLVEVTIGNVSGLVASVLVLVLLVYLVTLGLGYVYYKRFQYHKTQNKLIKTKTAVLDENIDDFRMVSKWRSIGKFYYLSLFIALVLVFLDSILFPPRFGFKYFLITGEIYYPAYFTSFFFQFSTALIQFMILLYLVFPLSYNIYTYKAYQRSKKFFLTQTFMVYLLSSVVIGFLYIINMQLYQYHVQFIFLALGGWICLGIFVLSLVYRTKIMHIYQRYFNVINIIFYHKTLQSLQGSESAEFYTKQFIVLQAETIKEILPKATPKNVKILFRTILIADILRLQKVYEFNNIPAKSTKAIVEYAMKISFPLIINLEHALQQHLTEQLLNKRRDPETIQTDLTILWPIVNKFLLQWESVTDRFYLTNV